MSLNYIIEEDLDNILKSDVNWSEFKNSNVLITGANGVLPSFMVEVLLRLNKIDPNFNVHIFGLVRNVHNARERFIDYLEDSHLTFIEQDVSQPLNISGNIDFIIHAASQASPKFYGIDPVGTLKANVLGTINLLDFARNNPIKSFLYFSSGEVYGDTGLNETVLSENMFGYVSPTDVRSCYAESKRMGENICVSYFHQFNIPTKIVRPFHTYGPRMKLDDGRVYADFVSDILNDKNISLNSDGSAIRAFCYLSDATIGFFKILLEGMNGEAYNIGNPNEQHSIFGLANIVVNIFPEKKLKVLVTSNNSKNGYLKSTVMRIAPDINKVKLLGWSPSISVSEGFRRTILSYKS